MKAWRYDREECVESSARLDWNCVITGVLQGSILGPLVFIISVNNLNSGAARDRKFGADDQSRLTVYPDRLLGRGRPAAGLHHGTGTDARKCI